MERGVLVFDIALDFRRIPNCKRNVNLILCAIKPPTSISWLNIKGLCELKFTVDIPNLAPRPDSFAGEDPPQKSQVTECNE